MADKYEIFLCVAAEVAVGEPVFWWECCGNCQCGKLGVVENFVVNIRGAQRKRDINLIFGV